jgi:hypothetical protein
MGPFQPPYEPTLQTHPRARLGRHQSLVLLLYNAHAFAGAVTARCVCCMRAGKCKRLSCCDLDAIDAASCLYSPWRSRNRSMQCYCGVPPRRMQQFGVLYNWIYDNTTAFRHGTG